MKLAAVVWNNERAYFFKGDKYFRYRILQHQHYADFGYPRSIKGSWRLPDSFVNDIDAAAVWPNGKAYFFKGDKYVRYDIKEEKADAGYPLPIAGNWPGLPDSFTVGIDAVVVWPTNGKAYFFSGDKYVRYDIADDKADSGYPKLIKRNWPGLPNSFASEIDAVVAWPTNGKAYFFKGDKCARYDIERDKTDPGYPKPMRGHWYGVVGGPFGDPDVVILFSQPANFSVFKHANASSSQGASGMFMIYRINAIVNNLRPILGDKLAPHWKFDLSRVFVSRVEEASGNTPYDQYFKSVPDNLIVRSGSNPLYSGGTLLVAVDGDPESLKRAFRPLHYRLSGVSVLCVRNSGDSDPDFIETATPEIAAQFKSSR